MSRTSHNLLPQNIQTRIQPRQLFSRQKKANNNNNTDDDDDGNGKNLKKNIYLYPNYFLVIDIYEYMTLEFEFMKQIEYKFLNPKGMQVFLNAPKQP